ncbi:glycosyltransferase family 2 protein [Sediminitomix flava]|uniref:Glycosyl transferase family 2 n=1 Tax=Sediminitomix flava TaxID=379075 RepID=A0A315Z7T6_SEDFL|nr:glycosyltransferase [Sediminitomix flava]PWJ40917.1 glycosyl transferase family 2 [Sediminitomix flava]
MEVSVIIPVYNAEAFVEKAVRSAHDLQEVKEIILIEDASPDGALEICQKLAKELHKVKLYRHHDLQNHGAGASRNLGIEKANSEYIAFLDADDFYLPHRFEKDRIVFESNKDIDGVYNAVGAFYYSEEAKELYRNTTGTPDTISFSGEHLGKERFLTLLKGENGFIHLNGLTLKKNSLFENAKIVFDSSLRLTQDTDFVLRLAWYLKLQASELVQNVAQRGIHQQNRCTDIDSIWLASQVLYENLEKELFLNSARPHEKVFLRQLIDAYKIHQESHSFSKRTLSLIAFFLKDPSFIKESIIRNTAIKTWLGLGYVGKFVTKFKRSFS